MLEAHERVSLCKQRPSHANDSDDELEYAAKDGGDDSSGVSLTLLAPMYPALSIFSSP